MSNHLLLSTVGLEMGCCNCGKPLKMEPYKFKNDVMPLEVCEACVETPDVVGNKMEGNNYLMYVEKEPLRYWLVNTSLH